MKQEFFAELLNKVAQEKTRKNGNRNILTGNRKRGRSKEILY